LLVLPPGLSAISQARVNVAQELVEYTRGWCVFIRGDAHQLKLVVDE
jgi:hypothetical protein